MRVLLDTHALLWWPDGDRQLGRRARAVIGKDSNVVYVSAASAGEIANRARLGKLPRAAGRRGPGGLCREPGVHAAGHHAGARGARRRGAHRDPFDRMLAAQSQAENLPVVTNDRVFEEYGVTTIW